MKLATKINTIESMLSASVQMDLDQFRLQAIELNRWLSFASLMTTATAAITLPSTFVLSSLSLFGISSLAALAMQRPTLTISEGTDMSTRYNIELQNSSSKTKAILYGHTNGHRQ